jgi:putative transposase
MTPPHARATLPRSRGRAQRQPREDRRGAQERRREGQTDGGYAGDTLKFALQTLGKWTIAIVERSDTAKGFVPLPRRRVVERALAWLNRNRRLAKDFEATIERATTLLYIVSVKLMSRPLVRV